jgi:hypothetical protein
MKYVSQQNTIFFEDVMVPADYVVSRNTCSWGTDLEMMVYIEILSLNLQIYTNIIWNV